MIALIDYGAGNLRSVHKALRFVGADVKVVTRPEEEDRPRKATNLIAALEASLAKARPTATKTKRRKAG